MPTTTLTSKGQLTLPKDVRDRLHLSPGVQFEVSVDEKGDVVLHPKKRSVRSLSGMLPAPPGVHLTIEEMNDAVADAVAEDYARIRRQQHPDPDPDD